MKKHCLILLFILLNSTYAEVYTCFYNGDDFHIIQDGFKRTYYAQDNFKAATIGCSKTLAAIYDGEALVIFDDEAASFNRIKVNNNYLNSKIIVTDSLVGFYDGKEFYIYNSLTKVIDHHAANDYIDQSQLVYFDNGIALYDGDDLIVYESIEGRFLLHFVDNFKNNYQLIGVGHGILFYDGDEVTSFCKNSFKTKKAIKNAEIKIIGRGKDARGLVLNEDIYLLDYNCSMLRINGFE